MNQRLKRLAGQGAKFAAGQSALQGLQALNGVMLVWLLGVESFAVYAVFTAAMGFSSMMMGFGMTPTIISLVGADVHDKARLGRYLYAGLRLRYWILGPVTALGLGLLWYSAYRIGYSPGLIAVLSLCLLASNYIAAQADLFSAPLQMLGRLGRLYQLMTAAEVLKLLVIVAFWSAGVLSAVTASMAAVAGLAANYYGLRRRTRGHIEKPSQPPQAEQRELWRLTLPTLPNAIFGALQGQITIIISGFFGSTHQIASVGALSRLSRIMGFLQAANPIIVGPALARMNHAAFWWRLPFVLVAASAVAAIIAISGFVAPELLLKVLGPNYSELGHVVWIVTLGAGLGYLLTVLGTVVSFRHWVAWWASFATIGAVILAQIFVALTLDLRTISGVLFLGVAANSGRLFMLAVVTGVARWRPHWLRSARPH